ncbi:MAG: ferritin-like domain-containing protein [Bacteroidales bacterium]
MGKGSLDVLKSKIDVDKLLEILNAALAEEWLAFYQYWVGAQVVVGFQRAEVEAEFIQHANEEFGHATMLAKRIKELDGIPVLSPQEWFDKVTCKYDRPDNFEVMALLKSNIAAERCAIWRYQQIADMTKEVDFVTCDLAKKILADEEEHEQDLVDFVLDIESAMEDIKSKLGK